MDVSSLVINLGLSIFMKKNWFRFARTFIVFSTLLCSCKSFAGFLEMPDTSEAPTLERESLLLDMDIPNVRERDPNPDAGPRLNVKEFRIQGLVEFPELGITREKLIKKVEAIRFDMMSEGKLLDSGYTPEEISEVSDLVAEIEKQTEGRHVGPVEVQRLVFLIREQRRRRGVTIGMIETVAATITRYYRERGFILAKAYIPQQHVRDGVVSLTLLLGTLGEVNVVNNKRYSEKTLKSIFKSDLNQPVTTDRIEEALYLANDYPGLSAQGYFEPGKQVGDTKLNLNVTKERFWEANLRLDNHGSERSGEYRAYADITLYNPLGIGDEIQIGILNSFLPQNSTYGSLRYSTKLFSPRVTLSLSGSTNDFLLNAGGDSVSGFAVNGKSTQSQAALKYQLRRSRIKNSVIEFDFAEILSTIDLGGGDNNFLDDKLQNMTLTYNFDFLDEKNRRLHQGALSLTSSRFLFGEDGNQKTSPLLFNFDYSMLRFVKLPWLKNETRVLFKSSGQYSGVSLSSINQFAIGGPTKARGFQVNEYYADDAFYLGADWIFKSEVLDRMKIGGESLGSIFQPFILVDAGFGKTYAYVEEGDDSEAALVNLGFGLKIDFNGNSRGSLIFSSPSFVKNTTNDDSANQQKGANVYFDLQYSF